ncbi:alpha/beta hydrolase [Aquabacterium sp. OR-4]|uniref:alpha/beta hydrolase n=1 Tax=Aquabacterium sp. OR-4 TaxID=2978127 RepID=UPI0028C938CE|nr:alpha/beta hydrolase [Aquabacterium sp. OR-4]MDT7837927.1 alpha/beta hydrolase [Aquabacterium sp. OR-4]
MSLPRKLRCSVITAVACAALGQAGSAQAAEGGPPRHVFRTVPATPMALPAALAFGGPASGPAFQWTGLGQERILRNVQRPQLFAVRPATGKANGRAVLVVPGGGYRFVAIENEGLPIARRLADQGFTAFVLVYRVKPTPVVDADFAAEVNAEIAQRFAPGAPKAADDLAPHGPAVEDARAAMAWLKAHATEQGFDAQRLGYIGFSAGARSGRALVSQASAAEMPDTLALIYGGFYATQPRQPVPPLFLAQAADDPLFPPDGFDIVHNWRQAGQRVELHLYERGGHGFGSMPRGTTADAWLDAYLGWLNRQ